MHIFNIHIVSSEWINNNGDIERSHKQLRSISMLTMRCDPIQDQSDSPETSANKWFSHCMWDDDSTAGNESIKNITRYIWGYAGEQLQEKTLSSVKYTNISVNLNLWRNSIWSWQFSEDFSCQLHETGVPSVQSLFIFISP